MGFVDDVNGVRRIFRLSVERKLIFRFAIGDFVNLFKNIVKWSYSVLILRRRVIPYLEPLNSCLQQTGEMFLHIANVVQLSGQWIIDIDRYHLPVGFALIDQRDDAEYLNLNDFAAGSDPITDFQHIDRIVVTLARCG